MTEITIDPDIDAQDSDEVADAQKIMLDEVAAALTEAGSGWITPEIVSVLARKIIIAHRDNTRYGEVRRTVLTFGRDGAYEIDYEFTKRETYTTPREHFEVAAVRIIPTGFYYHPRLTSRRES